MLVIKDTRKSYDSEKVLFPPLDYTHRSKSDITKYLRMKQPPKEDKGICYPCGTLFTDLSENEEEILNRFSRTTKQQIRKCIREDASQIDIVFYACEELHDDDSILADFKKTYMSYCERGNNPKLKRYFSDLSIRQYLDHHCILLSKAQFPNGKVYHLYVWCDGDSLFEYSASDHLNDEVVGILAGMANKLLVYRDMLWLKEHGVTRYDWGGIFNFDHPNGIDRFKMLFGGKQAMVYNHFVGNTMKGKLLVCLKKYQDSLRSLFKG